MFPPAKNKRKQKHENAQVELYTIDAHAVASSVGPGIPRKKMEGESCPIGAMGLVYLPTFPSFLW